MSNTEATRKQLKIKTGVVKRLVCDFFVCRKDDQLIPFLVSRNLKRNLQVPKGTRAIQCRNRRKQTATRVYYRSRRRCER